MSTAPATPSSHSRKAARAAALYLVFAALWIFASDRFLTLALGDPELLVRISMAKGFAFVAVTSLLLYLLLRFWDDGKAESGAMPSMRRLSIVFLGLALLVPLLGFSIVRLHGPQLREAEFADLRATATLKAEQIESWLSERQGDAEMLAGAEGLTMHAQRLMADGNAASRAYVINRLKTVTRAWDFDSTALLNASAQVVVSSIGQDAASVQVRQQLLPAALGSGRVQRSDLYRDDAGRIRLDYVVPLLGFGGDRRAVAAVLLHAPVERFLFPLIQTWPMPSASAETLLVRRDGDQVLFLNELRHRHNTALNFRLPLDSPNIPAVAAVTSGTEQVLEGVDYRGVAVLSVTRPVAGTPWHLVAKIDRDEVMAPLKLLVFWVSLVALVAVAAVAAAALLLWRQMLRAHRLELAAQATAIQRESERKAEAEILQLNADLEKKVEERTAQLKAINQELETFTYSVSHDLKAPLRGIDGYSRLLQEEHAASLNAEAQSFIANIRFGAGQMSQLIEDLLAYSRLERRPLQTGRIVPKGVADAVIAEFAEEIRQRQATVSANIFCLEVSADVDGLAMILRNFLDNALKFTRETPGPSIEIGGREEAECCILWVRDNGIGFDMKFGERIFEIFQRLQRAEDYPGTGIGLAIVKKAAQRMGGRVWAESAPGAGATFYLELPK